MSNSSSGGLLIYVMAFAFLISFPSYANLSSDTLTAVNQSGYEFQESKNELLCMEKADTKYDSKGLMKAELELTSSEIENLLYRLEDKGYFHIDKGLVTVDGGFTAKSYREIKDMNSSYCNKILEYGEIESDKE